MPQHEPNPAKGRAVAPHQDGVATLIIGQRVRDGCDDGYRQWLEQVNAAAADFPGFGGADVQPPTEIQPDWLAVYQFDSVANVQKWLNSVTRLEFLERAKPFFEGPGTQQVIARGLQEPDTLVTVVITHRLTPGMADEFLAWQKKVDLAESRFPGFCGSEVFRPIEGVQDEWTITYRFDSAEHLDAWLTSEERQELLRESGRFGDFTLRKIDHSFGNWFSFGDSGEQRPSDFKSSVAVWMGLYPTVVLLTLMLSPLGMPLWVGMLIGNLLSSFAMSYLIMPHYVNRLLGWWLKPRPDARQAASGIRGVLFVLAVNAAWMVIFYLVTVKFWTLP